jgi:hypothetical protein
VNGDGFQAQVTRIAAPGPVPEELRIGAVICLPDGGHFLLESHLDAAAAYIGRFLEGSLP